MKPFGFECKQEITSIFKEVAVYALDCGAKKPFAVRHKGG
jgi:hypothetical protein